MKNYVINASKEVVAVFEINEDVFNMKFTCSNEAARWIVSQHSELAECPHDVNFCGNMVKIIFYSIGNLVINEK